MVDQQQQKREFEHQHRLIKADVSIKGGVERNVIQSGKCKGADQHQPMRFDCRPLKPTGSAMHKRLRVKSGF